MSERDLSTMLRDHLSDEPPVGVRSHDAIRTARRGTHRRLALAGVAAVAALGLSAGLLPGLLADDGPTRARETPGIAGQTNDTFADRVDAVAQEQLAPYFDDLGPAEVDVMNVDADYVDPSATDAQLLMIEHLPSDTQIVQLSVEGFAPQEYDMFNLEGTCSRPNSSAVTCDERTLPDGTVLVTSLMPFTREYRVLSEKELETYPPNQVWWGRSAAIATPDGQSVRVTDYVNSPDLEDTQGAVPVEVLENLATDPVLLDPTGVAHAPVCEAEHTSC